ncbi:MULTISPECIES: pyruvate formate lyase family protein [unclassified Fusibacter]|uniref:glycyl radical protein n=1 Tax=unclassified Fusibacter TaxID=2624464 RepID=UPI001013466D|nr:MULTISPECIES: pyruvate formate lyase family protein [unclassified Fusibacter]MCK8059922.1 formate C-acetyltransferase/glycerol dehydratase family glycyl radical enzyme [Fusibacter sp. A2]NPE22064.1 formate C-acetyltransferase/glycerol dehydratase family glycyl radical enzyme [Fusibacter sp. A1]RXV60843.1 formate C-acetyltransferase/glycerol dehydratase family glycyl radical enzyme [Fusibacter sp. A1]
MRKRVVELRKQSIDVVPSMSMERACLVTDAYRLYEGSVSTPVLRALVLKHILEKKALYYGKGELIVGERGSVPGEVPTYPELCCHTVEDLEHIRSRAKIPFKIEDKEINKHETYIIPFWKDRSMRSMILKSLPQEWHEAYQGGIFTEFMEQRAPGHTVADKKVIEKGMIGFKQEINERLTRAIKTKEDDSIVEQLRAMLITADAIIAYGQRYEKLIEDEIEKTQSPQELKTLRRVLQTLKRVPKHPPRNTHEALQMYWFIHLAIITELNTWDAYSPGRLDQHLIGYYEKDLNDGFSKEDMEELLQCFWIKFNNQPAPPKVGITLLESGTYTDFANISLGGLKMDGSSGVNEVSVLLLKVIDEMALLQPSTNIQVTQNMPDDFLHSALKVIENGRGQPSLFNADGVVKQLLRQGKTREDAIQGGTSGCVETGAFGKEAYILTGYFNIAKIVEMTLFNGFDHYLNKRNGLSGISVEAMTTYDEFLTAFEVQMKHFLRIKLNGNHIIEKLFEEKMPAMTLSIVTDDCIERGANYHSYGPRYRTRYVQGVGIGSTADMLSVIKHRVYGDERLTIDRLKTALKNNFVGHEELRSELLNKTPKFGNNDMRADECVKDAFDIFFRNVDSVISPMGFVYRVNLLPTTCHVYFGHVMIASSDGRLSGEPLSEGISPVQGMDVKGPTSVILSVSKIPHELTGGTLLNQKYTPDFFKSIKGKNAVQALVRTYFGLGGHHIQFNVVDRENLLNAQKSPKEYKNLVVRVAGYSDYFNHLTPLLQNEIITRTAQM